MVGLDEEIGRITTLLEDAIEEQRLERSTKMY